MIRGLCWKAKSTVSVRPLARLSRRWAHLGYLCLSHDESVGTGAAAWMPTVVTPSVLGGCFRQLPQGEHSKLCEASLSLRRKFDIEDDVL